MSVFRPRVGYLLVLPDSDEDRTQSGFVLFSANMRRKRSSGLVLLHQMSLWWENTVPEGLLDGEHVLFEKWAWKEFVLGTHELWLIPERAVFATVEGPLSEELRMTRDELIEDLKMQIETIVNDTVPKGEDVTEEHADEIDGHLEALASATLAAAEDEEDEVEDEGDEENAK